MDNEDQFLSDMQDASPDIIDFFEALMYAMENTQRYEDTDSVRYFGRVAGGVFFADGDFDHTRWFPEMDPPEAMTHLMMEFGEDFIEDLQPYQLQEE